jgi:hypothetical protein
MTSSWQLITGPFGSQFEQRPLDSEDAPDEDEEPEDGSRADDSQWFAGTS